MGLNESVEWGVIKKKLYNGKSCCGESVVLIYSNPTQE